MAKYIFYDEDNMVLQNETILRDILKDKLSMPLDGYTPLYITQLIPNGSVVLFSTEPVTPEDLIEAHEDMERNIKEFEIQYALGTIDEDVLISKAAHSRTDKRILTLLSKDDLPEIRQWVADNSNTSPETLIELSKDKNINVRREVASNCNTPKDLLLTLHKSKDYAIRYRVVNNPSFKEK